MSKNEILEQERIETAADNWFNQWVETMSGDFDQVELDEFILID
ncbi:MAG: hypothetical protein ABI844_13960 [Saprospiraceae bacterium]